MDSAPLGEPAGARSSKDAALERKSYGESQWHIAWRSLKKRPFAIIAMAGLALLVLVCVAAPLLAPYAPKAQNYQAVLKPPSAQHLFGTDGLGRDILSRILWGGRETLRVALLAIAVAMGGGIVVGLISGYYGGLIDLVIQRILEVFLAFPTILLVLSIVAAIGPSLSTVLLAVAMSNIPWYSRLVRGSVLGAANMDYVASARLIGAKSRSIMVRHILPNVLAPVIVYATLGLGGMIMATAGLSYVGLGAQPPSPEWGAMLNEGRRYIREAWWMSVFPGLAIFLSVLSVNVLGDGLRDALDPRLRR